MIGYVLQQELGNVLPLERPLATLLTQIEVDPADPAFGDPTKPIGPVYNAGRGGTRWRPRRAGPSSPTATACAASCPRRCPGRSSASSRSEWLLEHGCVVICAGGGGIPVMYTDEPVPAGRRLVGVEAVIDKDLASALLAAELDADVLAIVTDVDAVYIGLGHARAARDPPCEPGGAGAKRVRRRLDGAEGPRRVLVRRTDRRVGRHRLDRRHGRAGRGEAGTLVVRDAAGLERAATR